MGGKRKALKILGRSRGLAGGAKACSGPPAEMSNPDLHERVEMTVPTVILDCKRNENLCVNLANTNQIFTIYGGVNDARYFAEIVRFNPIAQERG